MRYGCALWDVISKTVWLILLTVGDNESSWTKSLQKDISWEMS